MFKNSKLLQEVNMLSREYTETYKQENRNRLQKEFARLNDHYLDHAGATLYAESQLVDIYKDLSKNLYCNPHTSKDTADCIDQVRYRILQHFNTNTDEYTVVFTSGATGALKLVAESFNFADTRKTTDVKDHIKRKYGTFACLQDNHTSVLGMREVAASKCANVRCITHSEFQNLSDLDNMPDHRDKHVNSLFVYPAQCNFSGFKYPLSFIDVIKNNTGDEESNWFVMLDAASFVSTNFLDLSCYKPDFVSISFYKMFGYPTGLGALLILNKSSFVLNDRSYFGGGTVQIAMSGKRFHRMRESLYERFEDGTIPFLSILSLRHGFNTLQNLVPSTNDTASIDLISLHTFKLAKYVYENLAMLHHSNGAPVAKLYADTSYETSSTQGAIVNFNLLHKDGSFVGFAEVFNIAHVNNIVLRVGCFCNPGACQRHLQLSDSDLKSHFQAGHICGDTNDLIKGVPTGSVRVSFGYMSTKADADALINMVKNHYIKGVPIYRPPHSVNNYCKTQVNKSATIIKCSNVIESLQYENLSINEENKIQCNEPPRKSNITLENICVFPIKSCGYFKVSNDWEVGPKGLKYDREWMIVTDTGIALTQKLEPKMCLIKPIIKLENQILILSCSESSDLPDIPIPLRMPVARNISKVSLCQSKVCGDRVEGLDCGSSVAQWLSLVLDRPGLRLIKQSDAESRICKQGAKTGDGTQHALALSNQAQYLLINKTSIQWLVDKVDSYDYQEDIQGCVDRFRGNFIIETETPLEENKWTEIQIGNTMFQVDGPCTRCQMICIDQSTGEKTGEPLKTIAREFQGKMRFGIYLSCKSSDSDFKINTVKCGDSVSVIL